MDSSIVSKSFLGALQEAVDFINSQLGDSGKLQTCLDNFGWKYDPSTISAVPAALQGIVTAANDLDAAVTAALGSFNPGQISTVIQKANAVVNTIVALEGAAAGGPAPFNSSSFYSTFPRQVLDRSIYQAISDKFPVLRAALFLIGWIDEKDETFASADPNRKNFHSYTIEWANFGNFIGNPLQSVQQTYQWGGNGFLFTRYITAMQNVFKCMGVASGGVLENAAANPFYNDYFDAANPLKSSINLLASPIYNQGGNQLGINTMPIPKDASSKDDSPSGFMMAPLAKGSLSGSGSEPISASTNLMFSGEFNLNSDLRVEAVPGAVRLVSPSSPNNIAGQLSFVGKPVSGSFILVGTANSHRLQLSGYIISITAKGDVQDPEFIFEVGTGPDNNPSSLQLIIELGQSDGFIQKVFGNQPLSVSLSGTILWSSKYGISINGGAGFDIEIPLNLNLGPIDLQSIDIGARFSVNNSVPQIAVTAGLNAKGALGPLTFTVQNLGIKINITFSDGTQLSNVSNVDTSIAFNPPSGAGLSIDAGGFKGGGFLNFDQDKGEYSGGLQLDFEDIVTVTAIGILNTKMPDGSNGFSLFILISAEFTPIQLGFGFTLNGVGGLLGLNRTINIDPINSGLRTGVLDSILFPKDIVANAHTIISDLSTIFPPQESHFVFGPMLKVGWGDPSLITGSLGLAIEVPDPVEIVILGVIKCVLPDDDLALLSLKVAFAGGIDFGRQCIWFDAVLYDSRLLIFTLTGGMALRISWGDEGGFILTVGGFHPDYKPPPTPIPLGKIDRLGISLLSNDFLKISLTCYFAVTSNAVMFGAKFELYAGAGPFNLDGILSFDALFEFSPFHFSVHVQATVAIRCGDDPILSLGLDMTLEGTTPWHAKGSVSFPILFFTVSISFDTTWGDPKDTSLPPVEVWPILQKALQNKNNWQASIPDNSNLLVSLKAISDSEKDIVLHPFGVLQISQKAVPLGIHMDKFGNQSPSDASEFDITALNLGGVAFPTDVVDQEFAPAQYKNYSDADKISLPSFEEFQGGVSLQNAHRANADYFLNMDVEYEIIYLHRKARFNIRFLKLGKALFAQLLKNGAASKSVFSQYNKSGSALGTQKVQVSNEQYAITSTSDLKQVANTPLFNSVTEARQAHQQLLSGNTYSSDQIQVVPAYQMN
jgi:hypothetical protein